MFNTVIEYLTDKPHHGWITSVLGIITSILPEWLKINKDELMWCMQFMAVSVSIIAGIMTIISQYKKWKSNSKTKKKK